MTFTITLDSKPTRDLVAADLEAANGNLQAVTLTRTSDTVYTVVVQPWANINTGALSLKLKPATPLTDGVGNPMAISTSDTVNYDTKALSVVGITSNYADLAKDTYSGLNIAELKAAADGGVKFTIELDSPPNRNLADTDLTVGGGTLKANSLIKVSETKYTAVVLPPADPTDSGLFQLSLKSNTGLTDAVGNALGSTNLASASLPFDNKAPVATLFTEAIKSLPASGDFAIAVNTNDNDLNSITASLLGQTKLLTRPLSAGSGWHFDLIASGLSNVEDGYYTLKLITTDSAGNSSVTQQVLKMDRDYYPSDAWTGAEPIGTNKNQLFINRAGNQTFQGKGPNDADGAKDTYVWLARDIGMPGSPDVDTILDFTLGKGAQADKLDIRDLLGGVNSFSDLARYVRLSAKDTDGNQVNDSLALEISSRGEFKGTDNDAKLTDQVILLKNTLPTPLPTLSDLSTDLNLIWQTNPTSLFGI